MSASPTELARQLEQSAVEFLNGPENDLGLPTGPEPAFGQALIGYAAGDDPIWQEFKTGVHPGHWTPAEAFREAFGRAPAQVSVIAWVLPQAEATLADQKREKAFPAERWVYNRLMGHARACDGLARHLIQKLAERGVAAVAPESLPAWRWLTEGGQKGLATPWSQRHVAFAAGLGTFGLCDGLITAVGKAMRVGALVLESALPATPRPYRERHEYCLFYRSGACGKCISRCPAGAISKEGGHSKEVCREYLYGKVRPWLVENWPQMSGGPDEMVFSEKLRAPKMVACGLCQAGVPCATGIPGRGQD